MMSCCSLALRITKMSGMVRQSLAFPSSEVARHFYVQSNSVELSRVSLDCQLTTLRHRSNRSRRGLYDGKDIRSGNNVSFSMKKTKRWFKPNVFKKRVYSEILDEMIRFHITTSALRTIDKVGGLDNYLLNSRHVTDGEGLAAKKRILKVLKVRSKREARSLAKEATENEERVEEYDARSEIDETRPKHETSNEGHVEKSKREYKEGSKRDAKPEPSSLIEEKATENEEPVEGSKKEDEESSKRGE